MLTLGQSTLRVGHDNIFFITLLNVQRMDSEILWDILKFPNLSQVQPAIIVYGYILMVLRSHLLQAFTLTIWSDDMLNLD